MKKYADQLFTSRIQEKTRVFVCVFLHGVEKNLSYCLICIFFIIIIFPGQVLESIPLEHLLQNELPAKFFVTDVDAMEGTLPNNLVTILNHLGPMLKSESRSIQLTAFSLLQKYDFF